MKCFLCILAVVGMVALSGCALGPCPSLITIDQRGPVAIGDTGLKALKTGTAKAQAILIIGFGDASISTAMKSAGITRIHHVDNETLNVLGIYARYETVVYGD